MATVKMALRCMQLLPNGIGGSFMILDFAHKQVQKDFVEKMGFPWWFATSLGAYKLTQLALNWIAGGLYIPIAQFMMAFQLGGAFFTHGVAEGKGADPKAHAGVVVFFCSTLGIQYTHGALSPAAIIVSHVALAALGFFGGYAIVGIGPGGVAAAEALSPTLRRTIKRTFPVDKAK